MKNIFPVYFGFLLLIGCQSTPLSGSRTIAAEAKVAVGLSEGTIRSSEKQVKQALDNIDKKLQMILFRMTNYWDETKLAAPAYRAHLPDYFEPRAPIVSADPSLGFEFALNSIDSTFQRILRSGKASETLLETARRVKFNILESRPCTLKTGENAPSSSTNSEICLSISELQKIPYQIIYPEIMGRVLRELVRVRGGADSVQEELDAQSMHFWLLYNSQTFIPELPELNKTVHRSYVADKLYLKNHQVRHILVDAIQNNNSELIDQNKVEFCASLDPFISPLNNFEGGEVENGDLSPTSRRYKNDLVSDLYGTESLEYYCEKAETKFDDLSSVRWKDRVKKLIRESLQVDTKIRKYEQEINFFLYGSPRVLNIYPSELIDEKLQILSQFPFSYLITETPQPDTDPDLARCRLRNFRTGSEQEIVINKKSEKAAKEFLTDKAGKDFFVGSAGKWKARGIPFKVTIPMPRGADQQLVGYFTTQDSNGKKLNHLPFDLLLGPPKPNEAHFFNPTQSTNVYVTSGKIKGTLQQSMIDFFNVEFSLRVVAEKNEYNSDNYKFSCRLGTPTNQLQHPLF